MQLVENYGYQMVTFMTEFVMHPIKNLSRKMMRIEVKIKQNIISHGANILVR